MNIDATDSEMQRKIFLFQVQNLLIRKMLRIVQNHKLDLFPFHALRTNGLVLAVHFRSSHKMRLICGKPKDLKKHRGLMGGDFWAEKRSTSQQ